MLKPLPQHLNLLYDPLKNRYKGVYPSRSKWQAIVQSKELCLYLGTSETKEGAAYLLIQWYMDRYGQLWEKVVTRVQDDRAVPYDFIADKDGCKVVAYVLGNPIEVTPSVIGFCSEFYKDGRWLSEELAKEAVHAFYDIFRASPSGRPLLLRL